MFEIKDKIIIGHVITYLCKNSFENIFNDGCRPDKNFDSIDSMLEFWVRY